MINTITLKCPQCNANLEAEEGREFLFCSYCGTKIMLKNDNEHIYRHIDEAEVRRAEVENKRAEMFHTVRMRELEMEEQENYHFRKYVKIWFILSTALLFLGILGLAIDSEALSMALFISILSLGFGALFLYIRNDEQIRLKAERTDGKIKVPGAATNYEDKDYRSIQSALKSAGFTNIECHPMNDLTTGLLKKASTVDSVTINGESVYSGQRFFPNDLVVISYHSFAGRSK